MRIAVKGTGVGAPDIVWPRGRLELSRRVHVAGILNVTPDSFSDGGRYRSVSEAVSAALQMVEEGADLIDVGGESTRPGASSVDAAEEAHRVVPVISALRAKTNVPVSVDTRKAAVARAALDAGADVVNDISAFRHDPDMGHVCAKAGAPVVLMHMKGEPRTMQVNPSYDDVIAETRSFFVEALERAERAGVDRAVSILDPGIGFGKRFEDNLELVNRLDAFADLGRPLMMGASRKSFIGWTLGGGLERADAQPVDVRERLEGTIAVTVLSIVRGARIVRVHDVKANVRAVRMTEAVLATGERG